MMCKRVNCLKTRHSMPYVCCAWAWAMNLI